MTDQQTPPIAERKADTVSDLRRHAEVESRHGSLYLRPGLAARAADELAALLADRDRVAARVAELEAERVCPWSLPMHAICPEHGRPIGECEAALLKPAESPPPVAREAATRPGATEPQPGYPPRWRKVWP